MLKLMHKRIGAKSEAVPADNVAAEIESFQQSMKKLAKAELIQIKDALIAESTNMEMRLKPQMMAL